MISKHIFINQDKMETKATNELIGIAKGLIADGFINEGEAKFLCEWLEENKEYRDIFPINLLFERIERMLADNVIDLEEREELFEFLSEISGGKKTHDEVATYVTTLPLTKPTPEVIFTNKSYCFTGTFLIGQRKECEQAIEELGGIVKKTITQDLDYLVIGSKPTKDWKYSSFGTKIAKVIEYNNNKKRKTNIISEVTWCEAIKKI